MNNFILLFTSAGFCECSNEPSGSIIFGELFDLAEWLLAYQGVGAVEVVSYW
jgi:hypothetical protein